MKVWLSKPRQILKEVETWRLVAEIHRLLRIGQLRPHGFQRRDLYLPGGSSHRIELVLRRLEKQGLVRRHKRLRGFWVLNES